MKYYLTTKESDFVVEIEAKGEYDLFSKWDQIGFPSAADGGLFYRNTEHKNVKGKQVVGMGEYQSMNKQVQ